MKYYYAEENTRKGPCELEELRAMGCIAPDTLVWTSGMEDWAPASEVADFADFFPEPESPYAPHDDEVAPPEYVEPEPPELPVEPVPQYAPELQAPVYVPQPLTPVEEPKKSRKGMWVGIGIGAVVLILVVLMIGTNPKLNRHKNFIEKELLRQYVDEMPDSLSDIDDDVQREIDKYLENVEYHNYVLFSTTTDRKTDTGLTLGIFDHVSLKFEPADLVKLDKKIEEIKQKEIQRQELQRQAEERIREMRRQQAMQDSIERARIEEELRESDIDDESDDGGIGSFFGF